MTERRRAREALKCGHCGAINRMLVVANVFERESDEAEPEVGTRYQIQSCPDCHKIVLVGGLWHDGMDDPDDWQPAVLIPEPMDRLAREGLAQRVLDEKCMQAAFDEACKCESEDSLIKPKVGAVVARDNAMIAVAHRGELTAGQHAEYTLLELKCKGQILTGSTVYTTLEPCTSRNPPKKPCVDHIKDRKVSRVVIGMLDPDERIRGRGVLALRKANIRVDLFPPEFMMRLEELNREFIRDRDTDDEVGALPLALGVPTEVTVAPTSRQPNSAVLVSARVYIDKLDNGRVDFSYLVFNAQPRELHTDRITPYSISLGSSQLSFGSELFSVEYSLAPRSQTWVNFSVILTSAQIRILVNAIHPPESTRSTPEATMRFHGQLSGADLGERFHIPLENQISAPQLRITTSVIKELEVRGELESPAW